MDPRTHRRYLEYREKYEYFVRGPSKPEMLRAVEFVALDGELYALLAKDEDDRDDEEEARYLELLTILIRD